MKKRKVSHVDLRPEFDDDEDLIEANEKITNIYG